MASNLLCHAHLMSTQNLSRNHTLELIGITEELPTLPDRFMKIQHVLNDPHSNADDVADVVKTDQATSVMIMKIANSTAYNPMNTSISQLPQAIARLGATETANIALSMSLLYGFAIPAGMGAIRSFWAHAYAVGILCKHLVKKLPDPSLAPDPETMFLSGLLHDIGRAILGIRVDLSYFEKEQFDTCGQALIDAEQSNFGVTHAEAGSIMLAKWGMPDEIIEIVKSHHHQSDDIGSTICFIANAFANEHLKHHNNIETIHTELANGLFDKAELILQEKGLIPADEIDEHLVTLDGRSHET